MSQALRHAPPPDPHADVLLLVCVPSIIEGLYLLLNLPPWSDAAEFWTEKIWLDIPADTARTRLVTRHLKTGVETVLEAAEKRGQTSTVQASGLAFFLQRTC